MINLVLHVRWVQWGSMIITRLVTAKRVFFFQRLLVGSLEQANMLINPLFFITV